MTHYSALMLSIGFDIAVRRVQPITETKAINKVLIINYYGKSIDKDIRGRHQGAPLRRDTSAS